jgi:DNA repair exonuclease SbcCD ATPase subunit
MEEMKQDVAERLPRITAAAVDRLEAQFAAKLESESNSIKARYDASSERQRRELIEMQATQAEREARQRSMHADEKAELERLKYHAQRLQRRVDELEAENEESLRALRRRVPVSLDDGTNPSSAPLGFGRGSGGNNNPGASSSSRVNMSSYIAEQEDAMAQQTVAVLQAQLGVMKTQLSMALEKDYSARFTPSSAGAFFLFSSLVASG